MWKWAAASRRGSSHEKANARLQDAFSCFACGPNSEFFVAVVSDGAGSAQFGGQGANLICRTVGSRARRHIAAKSELPVDGEIFAWTDEVRDLLAAAAERRCATMRDFAATFVCLISNGPESVYCHVGDGGVVVREHGIEEWSAASWPENGEYASTTYFMTDDAELRFE